VSSVLGEVLGDGRGSVRVLVADDQHVASYGTVNLLAQRGFEVLAPVSDARLLSEAIRLGAPDVVVIEPAMGDRGVTLTTIAALATSGSGSAQSPAVNMLAFVCELTPITVEAALDSGCLGVVPKTSPIEGLVAGIRDVAVGERHLHPRAIAALLQRRQAVETVRSMRALSTREMTVLQRIAEGRSNADIAGDLGVSDATVKTHVAHILRKLQAGDRAHAVSRALRLGLFA
jgi:DNA-binding NarL/FixJ family response regulator